MRSEITPADISVAVITVSDRSHRGEREDRSGPAAIATLERAGFRSATAVVVPDGRESVAEAVASSIDEGADLVLTLGGTGVGPRDETPEGTHPLIDRELPGIAEGLRASGSEKIRTAVLSRGLAGISRSSVNGHRSALINLPGSPEGAREGIEYLTPILPHLIDQMRGGDH